MRDREVRGEHNRIRHARSAGISFYVPDGRGKIEHFPVANERDLAKAMSALKTAAKSE